MVQGLYDNGYIVIFNNGDQAIHRKFITLPTSVNDFYHVITDTDTLQSIARKYYRYSSLWYVLADVNDIIDDIFSLPVGDSIFIPNKILI